MSEESFAQMLDNEEWKEIRTGEVVDGRVIAVKPDRIVLNIGGKSDGIITRSEYTSAPDVDLTTVVSVGDEMKAKVLKSNDGEGQVALTYRKLVADNGNKKLEDAFNNQEPITGVAKNIKGGLEVIVDEARVFIPASLVSDTYEKDLSKYANQEIEFVITEFNPRRRRIIGNRKQLLLAAKAEKQKELMERIHVGDVVEGVVKNVTDFGAFIDLGGADGLLHISHNQTVGSLRKSFEQQQTEVVPLHAAGVLEFVNHDVAYVGADFLEDERRVTLAHQFVQQGVGVRK